MIGDIFNTIYNQIVSIPIENNLSWLYVFLNFILTFFGPSLLTDE